jgi:hypothetical protein
MSSRSMETDIFFAWYETKLRIASDSAQGVQIDTYLVAKLLVISSWFYPDPEAFTTDKNANLLWITMLADFTIVFGEPKFFLRS